MFPIEFMSGDNFFYYFYFFPCLLLLLFTMFFHLLNHVPFLKILIAFATFYFWSFFLFILFIHWVLVNRRMLRQLDSVPSPYNRLLHVCLLLPLSSFNIKEHIQQYKTKCFYKSCFTILYKLTFSIKQRKERQQNVL